MNPDQQTTNPAPDPAARLTAAATHLRALLANPQLTAGPWLSLDDGDRLLRNQPGDEEAAPIYVVNEPMSNGANAAWIAAMHPGVGEALAAWLESTAGLHEQPTHRGQTSPGCQWCADEDWLCSDMRHALAVADAILAGGGQ